MQTIQTSGSEVVEHRGVGEYRSVAEVGRYARMGDNFPRLWSNVEQVYQILRIEADDSLGTDAYRFQHIKSRTGSRVYTGGDRCDAIFIVYAGFLKTSWIDKYGNEKILDFPMKGDLIGFDGIESKAFKNTLVALSDIELIVVPLEFFNGTGSKAHGFRRRLMELMSQGVQACHRSGKSVGTVGGSPEAVAAYRKAGFDYIACGSDLGLLMKQCASHLSALREK